jgi:hypothetical protein
MGYLEISRQIPDKYGVSGGWEEHTSGITHRGRFSLFINSF